MDFIASTLAYTPENRVMPLDGCAHTFFDELRLEATRLPNGEPLPPMFDFTTHELQSSSELLEKVRFYSYDRKYRRNCKSRPYLSNLFKRILQLTPPHAKVAQKTVKEDLDKKESGR